VRAGTNAPKSLRIRLGDAAAHRWLGARELGDGDTCLIRRSLSADARTRAFSRHAAERRQLRGCEHLGEIFGQGESQQLLRAGRASARHSMIFGRRAASARRRGRQGRRIPAHRSRYRALQAAQSRIPRNSTLPAFSSCKSSMR